MTAARTFFVEHIETPTGRMRVVTDDAQRLRAVDWTITKSACKTSCAAITARMR